MFNVKKYYKKEMTLDLIPVKYKNHGLLCRWTVLEMLEKVLIEKQLISDIKVNQAFPFYYLLPQQKARSLSLLEIILRNLPTIDNQINTHLKSKTHFRVVNILRIAAAEIFIDKIASYAAVDCAVRLVKQEKKLARFSGLVNAVCRKMVKKLEPRVNVALPLLSPDFIAALEGIYDFEIIKNFGLAQGKRPPLDITVKNQLNEQLYADLLNGQLLPSGTIRLDPDCQITELPGYKEGDWWVQDFSASIPVRLLGSIAGLKVLDICAAPGGKTLQLASGGAVVTSVEISKKRAQKLFDNLARTKLRAEIIINDIHKIDFKSSFDIVLVDAPCSATGTIRRNCDLQYLEPHGRVGRLVKQQREIVRKAMRFVKPGGQLIYCTCSLFPAEGEEILREILQSADNWIQKIICGYNFGIEQKWIDAHGGLRLRPDYWQSSGGMDGFYIAILKRKY